MGKIYFTNYPEISMDIEFPNVVHITDGLWLDTNDQQLAQKDDLTKDILFGQKVKIKILTNSTSYTGEVEVEIKAKIGDDYIDFSQDKESLMVSFPVKNGIAISPPFYLNPKWYNEEIENYNYNSHQTEVMANKALTFIFDAKFKKQAAEYIQKDLPKKDTNKLRPIAYRRNYEELIGLFNTNNSGEKDKENNYENKFIGSTAEIKNIVNEFVENVCKEDITIAEIKKEVGEKATSLWNAAVKQVQKNNLDDRPLYWARNKMQTWLKRNPLFKDQIDFDTSIVKKGTELDDLITLFEEKSRNYTEIDFSKAGNKKKILITGFDPFVLNQIKYSWADINTQNPSGISALYFHNKTIGNAFIQTAIVPVRYEDFDNGIIENITESNIKDFNIMMTLSKNDRNFDIERFASKYRGGFFDNMNIGKSMLFLGNNEWNKNRFKQIPVGKEFYETTLPIEKIISGDLDLSKDIIFYDQTVIDDQGFKVEHPTKGGPDENKDSYSINKIKGKSTVDSGSGGDYLSNEIMYRATKKRDELGLELSKEIGHVHIADNISFEKANEIIEKIIRNATQ